MQKLVTPTCGFGCAPLSIRVRKTAKGKRVTVLNITVGDRAKAVTTLKQLLGVGGEVSKEDSSAIEIQGDQTKRLEAVLKSIGALPNETPAVSINKAYDKFAKKTTAPLVPIVSIGPTSEACKLVHGNFWPYCQGDCSFCPPLTDVFEGLDIFCDWYEPPPSSKPTVIFSNDKTMKAGELDSALEELGLKASVGVALRQYSKELSQRHRPQLEKSIEVPLGVGLPKRMADSAPQAVVRVKRKPPVVSENRPVRVILNNHVSSEEEFSHYILEMSLASPSEWISEYQEFIVSLLGDSSNLVHQELIDSKTLQIWFDAEAERGACHTLLTEAMPGFFVFATHDPRIHDSESTPDPVADEILPNDPVDMFTFQRLAADLGVDSKIEFWELFCSLIDDSDGSPAGIQNAFSAAVLKVTLEEEEQEPPNVCEFYEFSNLPEFSNLGAPPPP